MAWLTRRHEVFRHLAGESGVESCPKKSFLSLVFASYVLAIPASGYKGLHRQALALLREGAGRCAAENKILLISIWRLTPTSIYI